MWQQYKTSQNKKLINNSNTWSESPAHKSLLSYHFSSLTVAWLLLLSPLFSSSFLSFLFFRLFISFIPFPFLSLSYLFLWWLCLLVTWIRASLHLRQLIMSSANLAHRLSAALLIWDGGSFFVITDCPTLAFLSMDVFCGSEVDGGGWRCTLYCCYTLLPLYDFSYVFVFLFLYSYLCCKNPK